MALLVAVADSVFPNLDLARAVVSRAGAELRLSPQPTPEAIVATARDADAVLVTYAKINGDMIRRNEKVPDHLALRNRRRQRGHRQPPRSRESW